MSYGVVTELAPERPTQSFARTIAIAGSNCLDTVTPLYILTGQKHAPVTKVRLRSLSYPLVE